jgi:hypothetical protein
MPSGSTSGIGWADAPRALVRALERSLGARVVAHEDVAGGAVAGQSEPEPGRVAALLDLDDGRRVHADAVDALTNSAAAARVEREADVLGLLPGSVPHARLLARARREDWAALVREALPHEDLGPPWRSQGIAAARDVIEVTSQHAAPVGLPVAADHLDDLDAWASLASGAADRLDEAERARLPGLVAMSDGWRRWSAGDRLVHLDPRCENLVGRDDDVRLVGWSSAARGAAWTDSALLALDIIVSGHVGGPRTAVDLATGILAGLPYEATRFVVARAGSLRQRALTAPDASTGRYADAARALLERIVPR